MFVQLLGSEFGVLMGKPPLLLFAASGAALIVAGIWLLVLGLRSGPGWAVAWCVGIWIPYINLVLAGIYARRYWDDGARAPALLGVAGFGAQTIATLLLLSPPSPVLA